MNNEAQAVDWTGYLKQYDNMVGVNPEYARVLDDVLTRLRRLALEEGSLVADVGCGTGQFTLRAAAEHPRLRFLAVDSDGAALRLLTQKASERGLQNITVVEADARAWRSPEPVALCVFNHSLYTLGPLEAENGPLAALSVARQQTRPGGYLVATDIQRQLRYRRWALYILWSAIRQLGWRGALRLFRSNPDVRQANVAIERAQIRGDYALGSLEGFSRLVRRAGYADILSTRDDLYRPGFLGRAIDNQVVARCAH